MLQKLKEHNVPMEDTALGVAAKQSASAVVNNMDLLNDETKQKSCSFAKEHEWHYRCCNWSRRWFCTYLTNMWQLHHLCVCCRLHVTACYYCTNNYFAFPKLVA